MSATPAEVPPPANEAGKSIASTGSGARVRRASGAEAAGQKRPHKIESDLGLPHATAEGAGGVRVEPTPEVALTQQVMRVAPSVEEGRGQATMLVDPPEAQAAAPEPEPEPPTSLQPAKRSRTAHAAVAPLDGGTAEATEARGAGKTERPKRGASARHGKHEAERTAKAEEEGERGAETGGGASQPQGGVAAAGRGVLRRRGVRCGG